MASLRVTLFLVVHLLVYFFLDRIASLFVRAVDFLFGREASSGVFRSSPHSQRQNAVELHVHDAELAHSWFGWPVRHARQHNNAARAKSRLEATVLPFRAPRYVSHVNTILSSFKPAAAVRYHRETVRSFDGCELAIDWAYPHEHPLFRLAARHTKQRRRGPSVVTKIAHGFGWAHDTFADFGVDPTYDECRSADGQPADCQSVVDGVANGERKLDGAIGIMTIVPGLTSLSSNTYIRNFVRAALSHGFVVAFVHARGFGTKLTTPLTCHAGFTDDVRHWVYTHMTEAALHHRFGRALPVVVVGLSVGANVVANFIAQDGDNVALRSAVVAAAAVSAPWVIPSFHDMMQQPFQRATYARLLCRGLVQYVRNNAHVLRDASVAQPNRTFDWGRTLASRVISEFDEETARYYGFANREAYYEQTSCFPHLRKVKLPCVCVGVADDPICGPPPSIDDWAALCAATPAVCYAELPSGGHLGSLGDPAAEWEQQPTALESLVCRSMAHMVRRRRRAAQSVPAT